MSVAETRRSDRQANASGNRPGTLSVRSMITALAMVVPQVGWCQGEESLGIGDPWHHLLNALIYLAVVIGLILLTWYVLRRVSSGMLSASEDGPLSIIQTVSVGQGRMLSLAEVAGRVYLIAWTEGSAQVIGEFEGAQIHEPPE